jgi:hypothetical protein
MVASQNKPKWMHTLVLICAAAMVIWLARPLMQEPGGPFTQAGYFHLYPGERKIQLSSAFIQAKSIATARHVTTADIRALLNEYAREHPSIDAETLNKTLDERWPMK